MPVLLFKVRPSNKVEVKAKQMEKESVRAWEHKKCWKEFGGCGMDG
jgi:hypothetical protein